MFAGFAKVPFWAAVRDLQGVLRLWAEAEWGAQGLPYGFLVFGVPAFCYEVGSRNLTTPRYRTRTLTASHVEPLK